MAATLTQQMEEAINSIKEATTTYLRKKRLEEALALYNSSNYLQKQWEYHADRYHISKRFVKKALVWFKPSKCIDLNGFKPMEEGTNQVYIVFFYNIEDKVIYSKPGTTKRLVTKRITEELRDYRENGACYAKVMRLWNVGETPPPGLESALRSYFILKHPKNFKDNDRFKDLEISLEEADCIQANYAAGKLFNLSKEGE